MIKNVIKKLSLMSSLFICIIICGCSYDYGFTCEVKAVIVDSDYFTVVGSSRIFDADENGTVTFCVCPSDGYTVLGVDYPESIIKPVDERVSQISLFNLRYTKRITVECSAVKADEEENSNRIYYYFCGGSSELYGVTDAEYDCLQIVDVSHHIRANTLSSSDLVREGYLFTGWNTRENGRGKRVGAGSRISLEKEPLKLYAQWAKCAPENDFSVTAVGNEAIIVGYKGAEEQTLAIPSEIKGKKVVSIGAMAFKNCKAKTIVLPPTLREIDYVAFMNCEMNEIFFSDRIKSIHDDSFYNCRNLSAAYINAIERPKFLKLDYLSNFADKYDILIEHISDKKIVVFGGSGSYYSVDTLLMEKELPDYTVVNIAANAYFSAAAQLCMLIPYMGDGDILLHIPEAASEYQLMYNTAMEDYRLFACMEANYDLASLISLSNVKGFFDCYTDFISKRDELEGANVSSSYSDYIEYIDERGNYAQPKPEYGENKSITDEANIRNDFVNKSVLNSYYQAFENKGVAVLFANAAVNRHALEKNVELVEAKVENFDSTIRTLIDVPLILPLKECLYDGKEFFNSDYHLAAPATAKHTEKLIEGVKNYLGVV